MNNESSGTRRKYMLYLNKAESSEVLDCAESLNAEPYEIIKGIINIYFNSEISKDNNPLIEEIDCQRMNKKKIKEQQNQRVK